jgi:serine/threonine-protein kinase
MTDLAGKRIGQYEIVSRLGQGGMASVYRARQLNIDRSVAIKIIKPELVENSELLARFDREAQTIASLSHPHIVKLFDYGQQDGIIYFVMELLDGGNLADYLAKGPPSMEQVDRLLNQIGSALAYAHQQGIIHRDLKPQNVLLDKHGNAILTDFGIAHLLSANVMLTQNGETVGTPAYMPPEQWQSRALDARADIYALGVILYEMLSGQRPFSGDTPFQIMHKHLYEPLPMLGHVQPETPKSIERVVSKALAKQPTDRFESVEAMLKAFERARNGANDELAHLDIAPIELVTIADYRPGEYGVATTPIIKPEVASITQQIIPTKRRGWLAAGAGLLALIVVVIVLVVRNTALNVPATSIPIGNATLSQVAPVDAGDYMILVAEIEQVDEDAPAVTRFLVDDLKASFETSIPFSNLRVRAYPNVIDSSAQAMEIAKLNHAAVVIWGVTSDDTTDLQVQVGDLERFPHNQCSEEVLRRTSDVRVRLTDPRLQTASISALFTLVMAQACAGNGFEIMRLYSTLDELRDMEPGEFVGLGTATKLQQALAFYQSDTKRDMEGLGEIIEDDPGNPILYVVRASAYQRLGQYASARQDIETASRLGSSAWKTSRWASPAYLLGFEAFANKKFDEAINHFSNVIAMRPDDWFGYSVRGASYYMLQEYDHAAADLDHAVQMQAPINFPYMLGALIALRQGRANDARELVRTVIEKFLRRVGGGDRVWPAAL